MRSAPLLWFLVLLLASSGVSTSHADPAYQRRIASIGRQIEETRLRVPKAIEADSVEAYVMQLRSQILPFTRAVEAAKAAVVPELAIEGEPYKRMMAELAALEAMHERILLLTTPDFAAILRLHRRTEAATAELDALDKTLASLETTTARDPWAASHVAAFKKFAAELRAADAKVAVVAAERRARAAAGAKDTALRAAEAETRKRIAELSARGLAGTAVAPDQLAALEQKLGELDQQARDASFFLRSDLLGLRLLAQWQRPDGEAQQGLASTLRGTLEAQGKSSGKQLSLRVASVPDRCYLLLAQYVAQGDVSQIHGFEWTPPRGNQVQAFSLARFPGLAHGFCALRKESIAGSATLSFQGSKNAVRWAVVSFPRDELPRELAGGLRIERGDHCDPVYWEAMWTRPVPGSVAYEGNEPVIMLGTSELSGVEALHLNAPGQAFARGALTSKAPGSVAFKPLELEWHACPIATEGPNRPRAQASIQVAACIAALDKKYAGARAQIEGQRAAARDAGGIAPAVENRATELDARQMREGASCDAFEAAARREHTKLNGRLVDRLLAAPPVDPTERADRYFRARAYRP